jgi:hypothetical protein
MATKRIIAHNSTIHAPGPNYRPKQWDAAGHVIDHGSYDIIAYPPGTIVELDAAEADALLAKPHLDIEEVR